MFLRRQRPRSFMVKSFTYTDIRVINGSPSNSQIYQNYNSLNMGIRKEITVTL